MKTFDPQVLAADLIEVRKIFTAFFADRTQADWERHTEKFNQGWTLRETVAHLDAVGQAYQRAIISALAGKLCEFPGMTKREDLPTWNRREIDARLQSPISTIRDSFLHALEQAAELAVHLKPTDLTQSTRTVGWSGSPPGFSPRSTGCQRGSHLTAMAALQS
jgi:mycothiol maleylpyruvate isomerase-like protein